MSFGIWIELGEVVHALLGRKVSPESAEAWEEKEESVIEVEGPVEESQGWASENFLYFSDLSNFFSTTLAVIMSLVDEIVLSQWYKRKSRSSLVIRLEVCNSVVFLELALKDCPIAPTVWDFY